MSFSYETLYKTDKEARVRLTKKRFFALLYEFFVNTRKKT